MTGPGVQIRTVTGRSERGTTLVELLVVLVVTGLVLPIAFAVLLSVQRQTKATLSLSEDTGQVRLALQNIDREVRSAFEPLFVSPNGTILGLLIMEQPDKPATARCVQYTVLNRQLVTRTFAPGAPIPGWSAGALARGLDPTTVPFTKVSATQVAVSFTVADGTRSTPLASQLTARNKVRAGVAVDPADCAATH